MRGGLFPALMATAAFVAAPLLAASSPLPVERASVATLPDHEGRGWFWVGGNHAPSQIDGRFHLISPEGRHLGQLSNGFWPGALHASTRRDEVYVAETYFSRGVRGQRTDVVTAYDGRTLAPLYEVVIPPKRMVALGEFIETLSDDERFLLVMNYTPAQSVSVVDLERRAFVTEIDTPGCAAIYPAGPRDFFMLCGNGGFLHLRLDDAGQPLLRERIAPLFDPVADFYTTGASRNGDTWYFVSRRSYVHVLRLTPKGLQHERQWSLLSGSERKADEWRVGGRQHTSLHRASGRLYVLMHEGPDQTRQDPGTEVWVFDVASGKRVARHDLEEMTISLAVSQDPKPRLYTVDFVVPIPYLATLWIYLTRGRDGILKVMQQEASVYDADTGERRAHTDLPYGNLTSITPW